MSIHITDSVIYAHMWVTPEMSGWFSDEGRVTSWLEILACLAEAQAEVGLVPAEAAVQIRSGARFERLDLEAVAAETRASGHSTLGLIRSLQATLPDDAGAWVYYGATVQDLTDTWTALTFRYVGDIVARDLERALDSALRLAQDHRDTVMCGRTHGQPGLPITFGFKAAVWAEELRRHLDRLAEGRRRWERVQLGGGLGTLEFYGPVALPLLASFARRLQLDEPVVPWLTSRDTVAEFTTLLAMVTGTLAKIGTEVYELQRPEIGELEEPFRPGQVGSITMPHKRNPERSEHLDTLARIVRKDAALAVEGIVSQHERDGRGWKAEWAFLPEACALTGTALDLAIELLDGLQVNTDRMLSNVADRAGYVLSEPVMRALADRLGKHAAHDIVYRVAMGGLEDGVDFRTALLRDTVVTEHLDPAELDALLDPQRSVGAAPAFVDRAVAASSP